MAMVGKTRRAIAKTTEALADRLHVEIGPSLPGAWYQITRVMIPTKDTLGLGKVTWYWQGKAIASLTIWEHETRLPSVMTTSKYWNYLIVKLFLDAKIWQGLDDQKRDLMSNHLACLTTEAAEGLYDIYGTVGLEARVVDCDFSTL